MQSDGRQPNKVERWPVRARLAELERQIHALRVELSRVQTELAGHTHAVAYDTLRPQLPPRLEVSPYPLHTVGDPVPDPFTTTCQTKEGQKT